MKLSTSNCKVRIIRIKQTKIRLQQIIIFLAVRYSYVPWIVTSYKGISYSMKKGNLLVFSFLPALFGHVLLETQTQLCDLDSKSPDFS